MQSSIFVLYAVNDLISTYRSYSFFGLVFLPLAISLLFGSAVTKCLLYSAAPPIPRFSCMCVCRKHSQYTRDIYFWHLKVMAERQAFSLSAAFVERKHV